MPQPTGRPNGWAKMIANEMDSLRPPIAKPQTSLLLRRRGHTISAPWFY